MKIRAKISIIVISAITLASAFAACTHDKGVIVSTETTTVHQSVIATQNHILPNDIPDEKTTEITTIIQETTTSRQNDRYDNGNEDINSENIDRMEKGDIRDGDVIEKGDYIYTYYSAINGWSVEVADKTQEKYGSIKTKLYGIPIVSMQGCFYKCNNMVSAPSIPSTIENMEYCFAECEKLSGTIEIPENVTNLSYCFFASSKDINDVKIQSKNVTKATGMIDSDTKITLYIHKDSTTMNTIIANIPNGYDNPIVHL